MTELEGYMLACIPLVCALFIIVIDWYIHH